MPELIFPPALQAIVFTAKFHYTKVGHIMQPVVVDVRGHPYGLQHQYFPHIHSRAACVFLACYYLLYILKNFFIQLRGNKDMLECCQYGRRFISAVGCLLLLHYSFQPRVQRAYTTVLPRAGYIRYYIK